MVLTLAWHPFIRVDTASEAIYELVADTISEPQAGEPQAESAVEPEGGVMVDAPEDGWMDPMYFTQRKMSAKRISSNQH